MHSCPACSTNAGPDAINHQEMLHSAPITLILWVRVAAIYGFACCFSLVFRAVAVRESHLPGWQRGGHGKITCITSASAVGLDLPPAALAARDK